MGDPSREEEGEEGVQNLEEEGEEGDHNLEEEEGVEEVEEAPSRAEGVEEEVEEGVQH